MSVGNLKTSGQKGNNWTWQYKMLKSLQAIFDSLTGTSLGNSRLAKVARVTGSWTSSANMFSFSVANVGNANGTVQGVTIKPGEIVNYDAGSMSNYFATGSVTANGTGTELLITWITA